MGIFSKFCRTMIDKGGAASIGVICTMLYLNGKLPRYMGPVSYGVTTFGIFGFIAHISMYMEKNKCEDTLTQLDELERILDNQCKERNLSEILRIIAVTRDLVKLWRQNSCIVDETISELKVLQSKIYLNLVLNSTLLEFENSEEETSLGLDEELSENEDNRLTSLQEKAPNLFENLRVIPSDDRQNRLEQNLETDYENETVISDEDIIKFDKTGGKSDERSENNERVEYMQRNRKEIDDEETNVDLHEFEDCLEYLSPPPDFPRDSLAKDIVEQHSVEGVPEEVRSRFLQNRDDSLIKECENEAQGYRGKIDKLSDKDGKKSEGSEMKRGQPQPQNKKKRDKKTKAKVGIQSMEKTKEEAPIQKEVGLEFPERFDGKDRVSADQKPEMAVEIRSREKTEERTLVQNEVRIQLPNQFNYYQNVQLSCSGNKRVRAKWRSACKAVRKQILARRRIK